MSMGTCLVLSDARRRAQEALERAARPSTRLAVEKLLDALGVDDAESRESVATQLGELTAEELAREVEMADSWLEDFWRLVEGSLGGRRRCRPVPVEGGAPEGGEAPAPGSDRLAELGEREGPGYP